MAKSKSVTFYCFSPAVMLATFIVELILGISVLVRRHLSVTSRISAMLLFCLALFQLAEYNICGGYYPLLWARIGFGAITLLPVLGLHMISGITGKRRFVIPGYILAAVAMMVISFIPESVVYVACKGNYIIFQSTGNFSWIYFGLYFSLIGIGLIEAYKKIHETSSGNPGRKLLVWITAGYLSFLIPWGIVYILFNMTRDTIASVMCGFAVIFAVILGLRVVPLAEKK